MLKARLFKPTNNRKIRCRLCNHHCLISEGNTGICGVRCNKKGELYTLVYGHPVSLHLDPIEKKPLYHFMPGTSTLSFGTFGCNFKCDWCQNWDISQFSKSTEDAGKISNTIYISPKKIMAMAKKLNCPSISYTYTEPTIFFEYALDTMKLAHKAGPKNIWVSNGYFSEECFKEIEPYLDAINIDLKGFEDRVYTKYCGARLQPVLDNIKRIAKVKHIHLEITTLIIPGINDDSTQLKKIAEFIASLDKNIPWHLSRFFPCYKVKNIPITPVSTLKKAEQIGKKAGLKYVYLGNI